ncbi:IclR family transcriptional regulator [Alicyclobacillaceae bacterium I2511]|nr:IclR family transcriptional regulator [Alicyclobacillaceae bacterium I2511]
MEMVSTMRTDGNGVAVISKMVQILDAVANGESVNVSQLSEKVHLPRTTVFRILTTLVAEGVLTDTYQPATRLVMWAHAALRSTDLRGASVQVLDKLLEQYRETASVYVRVGDARVCLDRREGLALLRHTIVIGEPMPLHVGSTGGILLAWESDEFRKELWRASCERFPSIPPVHHPDWEVIRRQAWAVSMGERDAALASVSVPIFGPATRKEQKVIGALSISGAVERFAQMDLEQVTSQLKADAESITERLHGIDISSIV